MLLLCDARDDLLKVLKEKGIGCSKLHQPNHVYSGFASRAVALPGVERFMDRIFGRSRRLVGGATERQQMVDTISGARRE